MTHDPDDIAARLHVEGGLSDPDDIGILATARTTPFPPAPAMMESTPAEEPGVREMFEGKLLPVVDASRSGWWRFHEHYDRNGYCDNPGRGY